MSEYRKLVEQFLERYEAPVVDTYIQGFSGIDPPLRQTPQDHELLTGLLGGDYEEGHYHLTRDQLEWIIERINEMYRPIIYEDQEVDSIADIEITPYEIQGENLHLGRE